MRTRSNAARVSRVQDHGQTEYASRASTSRNAAASHTSPKSNRRGLKIQAGPESEMPATAHHRTRPLSPGACCQAPPRKTGQGHPKRVEYARGSHQLDRGDQAETGQAHQPITRAAACGRLRVGARWSGRAVTRTLPLELLPDAFAEVEGDGRDKDDDRHGREVRLTRERDRSATSQPMIATPVTDRPISNAGRSPASIATMAVHVSTSKKPHKGLPRRCPRPWDR